MKATQLPLKVLLRGEPYRVDSIEFDYDSVTLVVDLDGPEGINLPIAVLTDATLIDLPDHKEVSIPVVGLSYQRRYKQGIGYVEEKAKTYISFRWQAEEQQPVILPVEDPEESMAVPA